MQGGGTNMNITMDGKSVEIFEDDKNIVDVATRAGVRIAAPCYRADRKHGCCKACVVEVDGKQEYACATKPTEGANVVVDRDDLTQLRKKRLKAFSENRKDPQNNCACDCSGSTSCEEDNNSSAENSWCS